MNDVCLTGFRRLPSGMLAAGRVRSRLRLDLLAPFCPHHPHLVSCVCGAPKVTLPPSVYELVKDEKDWRRRP